jgi:hypothetical protein
MAERLRMGLQAMELPPGTVDPMFLHELALELHMPVGEMCGRMSAKELAVDWPAFYKTRAREQKRAEDKAAMERRKI